MFGGQSWQARCEETHLRPLAVKQRGFKRIPLRRLEPSRRLARPARSPRSRTPARHRWHRAGRTRRRTFRPARRPRARLAVAGATQSPFGRTISSAPWLRRGTGSARRAAVDTAARTESPAGRGRDNRPSRRRPGRRPQAGAAPRRKDDRADETLVIADVAEACGESLRQLPRRFHSTFGTSQQEFLIKTRVLTAARLLEETRMTASEIAQRCGFVDASRFAGQFRQRTGLAPLAYRRAHIGTPG